MPVLPQYGGQLTKRQRFTRMNATMETTRERWRSTWWQDIRDFCLPQHGQFFQSERTTMGRNTSRIIDGTATRALRTLANGLLVGINSPARPWFKLGPEDPEMANFKPVAVWLETVTTRMHDIFRKSNLYNCLQGQHLGLGAFGTAAMGIFEDMEDVIRCYPYPIGSYCISNNARLRVDTMTRLCNYTVRQLVERFGVERLTPTSKALWDRGDIEANVPVMHAIAPNQDYDPRKLEAEYKKYTSFYWESGSTDEYWLGESGFDEFPILAPRWVTEGEDAYGLSPAMDCLGDIKALQTMHRQKARGVEKMVDPALMGPSSLRQQQVSTQPGRITYLDIREGMTGLRPVHEVNLPLGEIRQDIQEVQRAIKSGLYEDLFLMLANSDRREITAEEIRARQEEKILALSPLLERLDDEQNDPLIDRAFNIMNRFGMFPPPPQELQGKRLRVEYTSIMAQTQKSMNLGTIERTIGWIGAAVAPLAPQALDIVDFDEAVREYGASVSLPAKILRDSDGVTAIRQQRQQAQDQAQQIAQAEQAAKAAKTLSETNTTGDNALTDLASEEAGAA